VNALAGAIVLTAGGTGGHIFPALSLALELRRRFPATGLVWIGTSRSREKELCEKNGIPMMILDVTGIRRALSLSAASAALKFAVSVLRMTAMFGRKRPLAVVAFGGYVCAPVLAAARFRRIPYFLQEQNTIAGLVNRLFAKSARRVFLGMALAGKRPLACTCEVTGTPVRARQESYDGFAYPAGFSKAKSTVLVCGGSQGAQSMNDALVPVVKKWAESGLQVVWQTGAASFDAVTAACRSCKSVFVFSTIADLYPFYAAARVMVGRAGASTLAEVSSFGLPAVLVPLPWAAENHQWFNAGLVEEQGWAIRVAQDGATAAMVEKAVHTIVSNDNTHGGMRAKALENSPADAAKKIVETLAGDLEL
jgi:UDP-N-acetylglucosamine--N-acetylmuramyl-(pentapeptide) pyrophosphoryl-undecaprenol N-acetylglucosamine transferase